MKQQEHIPHYIRDIGMQSAVSSQRYKGKGMPLLPHKSFVS